MRSNTPLIRLSLVSAHLTGRPAASALCQTRPLHAMSAAPTSAAASGPAASATPAPALHPNVVPISALLGRWVGTGRGVYPTIQPFEYEEELEFRTSGRPFVAYTQRTWMGANRAKPMHEENGFLRFIGGPASGAKVEALLTQASGVQELLAGSWATDAPAAAVSSSDAGTAASATFTITLETSSLTRSPSARPPFVTQVARRYTVNPATGTLSYEIDMATERTPQLQNHLKATLKQQASC